jgi:hypothetical membrane protein
MGRVPTTLLLAAGVAGPILFVLAFTVLGAIRPGFAPMRQFVSLLSLSDDGWTMTLTFLVSGGLVIAGAVGIRRSLRTGPGCRWIPRLAGLAGVGLVVAGIFPTDPLQGYPPGTPEGLPLSGSWHAGIHVLAALLLFVGLPVASFIAARRFAAEGQGGWTTYSLASGIVMIVANAATSATPGTVGLFPDIAGLLQRVSLIAGLGWLALLSLRTMRERGGRTAVGAPTRF